VEPAKPGKLERKVRRRRKETKEPAGV